MNAREGGVSPSRIPSMIPEKWIPVFGQGHAPTEEHDPEKWTPVFGKDHAPTRNKICF
jgi:hypothetical protein